MALYGLKSSGAEFRGFLAEMIDSIGFSIIVDDPDVWMRAATKPTCEIYYKHILCCVYNILCISHYYKEIIGEIQKNMKFNNDNIEEPDLYLGASLKNKELNSWKMWTMNIQQYINNIIKNLEKQLKNKGLKLTAHASNPTAMGYQLEVNSSPDIDQDGINIFKE